MADTRTRRQKLEAMASQTVSPNEADIAAAILEATEEETQGEYRYDDWYDRGEWGWVGSPNAGHKDGPSGLLTKRRSDLIIHGGVTDDNASYSYDDWAVVELDGKYYLCQTSGCSCPSPSETWGVESGPFDTVDEMRQRILSGSYDGWTVVGRQLKDFLELFANIEANQRRLLN